MNLDAICRVSEHEAVRCRVRNISSMGAFIEFERPTIVPRQFKLIVPEHWFEAECEVRHAGSHEIGVLFKTNRREALARFPSPFGDDG